MNDDTRCCGSGTCIINAQGLCWCGQQWDGEKMCHVPLALARQPSAQAAPPAASPAQQVATGNDISKR